MVLFRRPSLPALPDQVPLESAPHKAVSGRAFLDRTPPCSAQSLCLWRVGLAAAAARQLLRVAVGQLAFETSVWGKHNRVDATVTRSQSTQLFPNNEMTDCAPVHVVVLL